jgi:hypothetical protein
MPAPYIRIPRIALHGNDVSASNTTAGYKKISPMANKFAMGLTFCIFLVACAYIIPMPAPPPAGI